MNVIFSPLMLVQFSNALFSLCTFAFEASKVSTNEVSIIIFMIEHDFKKKIWSQLGLEPYILSVYKFANNLIQMILVSKLHKFFLLVEFYF